MKDHSFAGLDGDDLIEFRMRWSDEDTLLLPAGSAATQRPGLVKVALGGLRSRVSAVGSAVRAFLA